MLQKDSQNEIQNKIKFDKLSWVESGSKVSNWALTFDITSVNVSSTNREESGMDDEALFSSSLIFYSLTPDPIHTNLYFKVFLFSFSAPAKKGKKAKKKLLKLLTESVFYEPVWVVKHLKKRSNVAQAARPVLRKYICSHRLLLLLLRLRA